MEDIYAKLNDDIELISNPGDPRSSEIRKFYAGKTILLSGCTGYIGKCLVEKLLRGCPEVKRIYVIIRPKKGMLIEDRLNTYFQHVIFDKVRKMFPNCESKITGISGDFMEAGLGISSADRQLLQQEVDIIIHNAAAVNFTERVKKCLTINVLGTKEMLDLAVGCSHLVSFVYVSTAFSHCYKEETDEVFYPPPADLKMVRDMIQADTENQVGLTEEWITAALGEFPNIYTYSKATAEGIVQEYSKKVNFPCVVYRPSIVTSTYHEPLANWCGNKNGPQTLILFGCLGYLHIMYTTGATFDIVPADMTTNALLATIWYTVVKRKDFKEDYIYNFSTSIANHVTVGTLEPYFADNVKSTPSIHAVWYYSVIHIRCFYALIMMYLLTVLLPVILLDIASICRLRKPVLLCKLVKLYKVEKMLRYFYGANRLIDVTEMSKVWDNMSPIDKKIFYCDLRTIDWSDYCSSYWEGLRVYLLNEPMDNLEVARRRYKKLKIVHYVLVWSLTLLLVYFALRVMNSVFGIL